MRSGHTEAAVDLCRIAGLPPVAAICELANDDGTVMRGPQITAFAERHRLKCISVAELISYRQAREKLVEQVATFPVTTQWGPFAGYAYTTPYDPVQHVALVHGAIGDGKRVPVRLHRAHVLDDIFSGGQEIDRAMRRLVKEGRGVFVYLRDGTAGVPATNLNEQSQEVGEATHSELYRTTQWREVGLGAQILRDLGVTSIVNLSSTSRSYIGLAGFGIEIAGQEKL